MEDLEKESAVEENQLHATSLKCAPHKFLEAQAGAWEGKYLTAWFHCEITWTRHCDHAGIMFYFQIGPFFLEIGIKDDRHWNYGDGIWEASD